VRPDGSLSAGADDARRRNDEVVRGLRDVSARRVDGERRRRAFSSWCALATLAGGISLVALNAQESGLSEQEALVQEQTALRMAADRDARIANACANRAGDIAAIYKEMREKLARAKTEEERERVRADAMARRASVIAFAAAKGCDAGVTTQPAGIPEHLMPEPHPNRYRHDICHGDPLVEGL
jgi:hypothetical protein